jgi:hypothetical protein
MGTSGGCRIRTMKVHKALDRLMARSREDCCIY